MAVTTKKMAAVNLLTASDTTYYTAPIAGMVTSIILNNKSTSPVDVTVTIGGVAMLFPVQAKQTFASDSVYVITASDTVKAYASAASAVACYISGVEVS